MDYNNINILRKFLYNRVDYDYFKKLLEKAYDRNFDEFYIMEKFEVFISRPFDVVLSFGEGFINIIAEEIERIGYVES